MGIGTGIFLWGRDWDVEYFTRTEWGWGKCDGDGVGWGQFYIPCHSRLPTNDLTSDIKKVRWRAAANSVSFCHIGIGRVEISLGVLLSAAAAH